MFRELHEITISHTKNIVNTPSSIDDDLLLFDKFEDVPLPTEQTRMQCLFVALCIDGQAQYTVDTNEYKVVKGDLIIITDGQVVGNYLLSPNCKGVAIMASDDFFHEILKEVHEISQLFLLTHTNPVLHLNKETMDKFCVSFGNIKKSVDNKEHHFRREVVLSMLKTLIYELGNEIWNVQRINEKKNTRAESIFANFIGLVEKNFRVERRVGWYAEKLCITPKYLSETVKLVSKKTPNDWIDSYVTLEIRVLLKNSSKSIKEIASDLNFPTQSFLGKYFKEHVGLSPSQYRKK